MLRLSVVIIGLIFVAKGALGFNSDYITVVNGVALLFETFAVNDIINWIHLLTGFAALLAAASDKTAKLFCQVFGVIYMIMAIIGFFQGTSILGLFQTNIQTSLANFILGAMMVTLGFGIKLSPKATVTN
ncbi:MAG TPA: DUF4383 domain-containing protein [Candidatus Saccharimonadales bacterium]|nr:DUF4383 domain-containing protein [Candidatus Saccharimonadales bacterium]